VSPFVKYSGFINLLFMLGCDDNLKVKLKDSIKKIRPNFNFITPLLKLIRSYVLLHIYNHK